MKPVEIIFYQNSILESQDKLEQDRRLLLSAYVNTYRQIAYHVELVSALCKKHGRENLLSPFSPEVRQAFDDSLLAIKTLWENCSPYPFPEIHDEPVEEESSDPGDAQPSGGDNGNS
ncbi:MAG: hypothetical protein KatS3mg104_3063 [Phycisphaerae bacterium]|nr:MAG: hypothetical protein KatS3mg104_3063 [Phycisphaerae bacterium]